MVLALGVPRYAEAVSIVVLGQNSTPHGNAAGKAAVRALVSGALDDPATTRIVIRGGPDNPDAVAAAVLARLMIAERLDVEVAYVAPVATPATRRYGLPHGPAADTLAQSGNARAVPLIRDDAATVLLGRARQLGEGGAKLHGESYVDNERLFTGDVRGVVIEPLPEAPGVRARLDHPLRRRWETGRAAQTGGTNLVVEREGVLTDRVVKRSTFYRHHVDLLLVLP